MKKTTTAILAAGALFAGILIGGCSNNTISVQAEDGLKYFQLIGAVDDSSSYGGIVYEFRDGETGIHYFYCSKGGICGRYADADGTLYVD